MTTGSNELDFPTWEQVTAALDSLHLDRTVSQDWRDLAIRLSLLRRETAGLNIAHARLSEAGDPGTDDITGAVSTGYATARNTVYSLYVDAVLAYAHRAHLALALLASHAASDTKPVRWHAHLPGEENLVPASRLEGMEDLPEVRIPAAFAALPLPLVRYALRGFTYLRRLGTDYEDAYGPDDDVPEHEIGQTHAIRHELDTWPQINLTYGDAVAYTLATELADRMRTETTP